MSNGIWRESFELENLDLTELRQVHRALAGCATMSGTPTCRSSTTPTMVSDGPGIRVHRDALTHDRTARILLEPMGDHAMHPSCRNRCDRRQDASPIAGVAMDISSAIGRCGRLLCRAGIAAKMAEKSDRARIVSSCRFRPMPPTPADSPTPFRRSRTDVGRSRAQEERRDHPGGIRATTTEHDK